MENMASPVAPQQPVNHVAALERLERRFQEALRDLRALRMELQRDVTSKGVLGSRGLTQFVLEQLQQVKAEHARCRQEADHGARVSQDHRAAVPAAGIAISNLLRLAELAGYEPPTARLLSKRLTERAYRTGDIQFDRAGQQWVWQGTAAREASDG